MTDNPYDALMFTIPDRPADALGGSEFCNSIMNVGPTQAREDAIFAEYQKGNVPDFVRNPFEVSVTLGTNVLKYLVLPDVLCVGTDSDFVRTPLGPLTAQKVADLYGCILPTKRMADQIWKSADLKLNPDPNGPPYDQTMQTTNRFVFHNDKVQKQLNGRPFTLLSGHKKDVVICKHLTLDASRVAIYGWFFQSGSPIQGLNPSSHDKYYKDYSHGIRMINRNVTINDNAVDIYDVLKDPNLAALISDEGAFDASKIYKS